MSKPLVPGEKARVKLGVHNVGNVRADGSASVTLYAAADPEAALAGAMVLGNAPVKLKPNPGQSGGMTLNFTLPRSMAAGTYTLVAVLAGDDAGVRGGTIVVFNG